MDSTCRTKTVQSLVKDITKKDPKILLSHKLQRKEGQWNKAQKSDLIDSLLRKYPINPSYGVKENDTVSIIDGVQRLSTIRDYLNDGFALSKLLETVTINNEEKKIAGKKFSKLDEETQDALKNSELQVYELTGCTEKDVREIFRRQNSGFKLNSTQLRTVIETDEMADVIYSLTSHPFFDKVLTATQRKRDVDKEMVRETLMLIETNAENDYTSFKSKNINDFIAIYQENIDYNKIEILKQGMDKLDENFTELKNVTVLSLPMILFVSYRCIKDKKSFSKLVTKIQKFVDTYDNNEEYKKYCQYSTTSPENVRGRFDYWRNVIREL